jgi:hypothetical protein
LTLPFLVFNRGRSVPDFGDHPKVDHGLGVASWFCLGLIMIALVAAVFALF